MLSSVKVKGWGKRGDWIVKLGLCHAWTCNHSKDILIYPYLTLFFPDLFSGNITLFTVCRIV